MLAIRKEKKRDEDERDVKLSYRVRI